MFQLIVLATEIVYNMINVNSTKIKVIQMIHL